MPAQIIKTILMILLTTKLSFKGLVLVLRILIVQNGNSADKHVEVEQLNNLLVDKKDIIDRILESKPVYAIGPNFYKNYSFPFITCWATSELEPSVLEQPAAIFDYKFIVRCQIIEPIDGNDTSKVNSATESFEGNNNNGGNSRSSKSNNRSGNDNYRMKRIDPIEHLSNAPKPGILRQADSAKTTSSEWDLQAAGTGVTGYSWLYEDKSGELNLKFEPGLHKCKGRILIDGYLARNFEIYKTKADKMPPSISYNDLKDFNEKFAKLNFHQGAVEGLIFTTVLRMEWDQKGNKRSEEIQKNNKGTTKRMIKKPQRSNKKMIKNTKK
ncbi:26846_t:CDS:2 [Dentiscutata erythropus]|uniref:26846_t:CDS:1 n=1 Tax=Dentiscutata erythropus TaxID=1348616 RepID=A0A9N8WA64_9GLOM|nr:26846_t:CDS:2 [Dentiscutata erythropus]